MPYPREAVEAVKAKVLQEAAMMREMNKILPVSGVRYELPAKGRTISMVYYQAPKANAPLCLGFHGGGFLFGGSAMNDAMWSAVAKELCVNVASIEYRKSPQFQYMDAVLDAWEAAMYLKGHAEEFGHSSVMYTMGCSAGANIAAAVCLYGKQQGEMPFAGQLLMYPFLDADTDPMLKGKGSLEGPIMQVFNELHCLPKETRNPLVSPVFADRELLTNQPPAIFVLAEVDNLKVEGEHYAKKLTEAGVKVELMVSEDMPHGFFESGFGKISEEEMNFLGEDVKQKVRSGEVHEKSVKALEFIKEKMGSMPGQG